MKGVSAACLYGATTRQDDREMVHCRRVVAPLHRNEQKLSDRALRAAPAIMLALPSAQSSQSGEAKSILRGHDAGASSLV
jgi:hypothetical protein